MDCLVLLVILVGILLPSPDSVKLLDLLVHWYKVEIFVFAVAVL